jgi:N utilization substance protein B
MKTANDPRHQKRITLMQQLFSFSFQQVSAGEETEPLIALLPQIDARIEKAAPEWPLAKIARIDLAILRLAVWELCYDKKNPAKVVIDEAVELAKSYGNEHSAKFVNGVLGTIALSV